MLTTRRDNKSKMMVSAALLVLLAIQAGLVGSAPISTSQEAKLDSTFSMFNNTSSSSQAEGTSRIRSTRTEVAARPTRQRTTRTRTTTLTQRLLATKPPPSTHTHTHTSHTAHPTTTAHRKGGHGTVVSDPIPGSAWEKIRQILLIPLCTLTVLTFIAGLGMYVAATWGSGEGWFGRPLTAPGEEAVGGKGKTIQEKPKEVDDLGGIGEKLDEKAKQSEEEEGLGTGVVGVRQGSGEFRYRVPSLNSNLVKQT